MLAGLAVLVVVAGVVAHLTARRGLAEAEDRLAERRRDMAAAAEATAAARARVGPVVAELEQVEADLASAEADVAAEAQQRAEAQARLDAAQAHLEAVQDEVEAATLSGRLQARQVEALHQCLRGVTGVLNALAVDDVGQAIEGLVAVEPACREAEAIAVQGP